MADAFERYVTDGRLSVHGWFAEVDARLFHAVAALVPDEGHLVEVGTFFGASAVAMGFLRGPGECLTVIDPFEDIPEARRPDDAPLTVERFLANWRRFHTGWEPAVLVGISSARMPDVADRSARFVHIDGYHSHEVVTHDIAQACRIATPNAVLVFDDAVVWHWPGVAAAVWGAVERGELVPLAVTAGKLYATVPGSAVSAAQVKAAAEAAGLFVRHVHEVREHGVCEVCLEPEAPPGEGRVAELVKGLVPPTVAKGVQRLRRKAQQRWDQRSAGSA